MFTHEWYFPASPAPTEQVRAVFAPAQVYLLAAWVDRGVLRHVVHFPLHRDPRVRRGVVLRELAEP